MKKKIFDPDQQEIIDRIKAFTTWFESQGIAPEDGLPLMAYYIGHHFGLEAFDLGDLTDMLSSAMSLMMASAFQAYENSQVDDDDDDDDDDDQGK